MSRRSNQAGGIDGRPLALSVHDDADDPEQAKTVAAAIAAGDAVAVIGHDADAASAAAAETYEGAQLPAITYAATAPGLTRGRPHSYRVIYDDAFEGRFVARFVDVALDHGRAAVVWSKGPRAGAVADAFAQEARHIGLTLDHVYPLRPDPAAGEVDRIAEALLAEEEVTALFILLNGPSAVRLVGELRDGGFEGPLIVTGALAAGALASGFSDRPAEQRTPGHYTRGIHVAAPFNLDIANRRAQQLRKAYKEAYGALPPWRAAFAYDAALLIGHALATIDVDGQSPPALRAQVAAALANNNGPATAVRGATGLGYFDEHGDVPRSVAMGSFRNAQVEAGLVQLGIVHAADPPGKKSVPVGNRRVVRTDVVHTGFRANAFHSLDLGAGTFEVDVHIWFRHRAGVPAQDIIVLNDASESLIGDPIDERIDGDVIYRAYRVNWKLEADYFPQPYGRHLLGASFRHRNIPLDQLVYARDRVGSGVRTARTATERVQELHDLLDPDSGWAITGVEFVTDTKLEHSIGHPDYLERKNKAVEFSRYNIGVIINKRGFTMRSLIPAPYVALVLLISALLSLILGAVGPRRSSEAIRAHPLRVAGALHGGPAGVGADLHGYMDRPERARSITPRSWTLCSMRCGGSRPRSTSTWRSRASSGGLSNSARAAACRRCCATSRHSRSSCSRCSASSPSCSIRGSPACSPPRA